MNKATKNSLLRRGSKTEGQDDKTSPRVSASASFSSIPTPHTSERASTLPSIRSLRNRFFHPNGSTANGGKASAGPKVVHGSNGSSDLATLFISPRSPTSTTSPVIPSSASYSSYEAARPYTGTSTSGTSIKSSMSLNSLLPRPTPPNRFSSRRHSATLEWPSETLENGDAVSPGTSSISAFPSTQVDTPDSVVEETPDLLATATFGEIPQHADDGGDPYMDYHRGERLSAASLNAVGGISPLTKHLSMPHSEPADSPTILPSPIIAPALPSSPNATYGHLSAAAEEDVTLRPTSPTRPDSALASNRAPSSLAAMFSEQDGGTLRRGPTPQQPSFTQHLNGDTLLRPDGRTSPAGGARSPLDALVFGLGGRPISRTSSYATSHSGGRGGSSTETGPSSHAYGHFDSIKPPSLPQDEGAEKRASMATQTDTTSVAEMELEIRKIESESSLRTDGAATTAPPSSGWSATTGSAKSSMPFTNGDHQDEQEALLERLPRSADEITPRSAKRWSIIEMEESFRRMQNMLQSSRGSTFSMAGMTDDGGATPNTNSFIVDRAMASLHDSSNDLDSSVRRSAYGADVPSPLLNGSPAVPQLRVETPSRPTTAQQAEMAASPDTEDEPTLLPGGFPSSASKASRRQATRTLLEEDEDRDQLVPSNSDQTVRPPPRVERRTSASHIRRHTLDDTPSHEELRDLYRSEEPSRAATATPTRAGSVSPGRSHFTSRPPGLHLRRSRTQLQPIAVALSAPRLARSKTDESINSAADTLAGDDGWATPRSSVSPAPGMHTRSLSSDPSSGGEYRSTTPVMRSRAGRGWARERERGSTPTSSSGGDSRTTGPGPASPTKVNGVGLANGRQFGSARYPGDVNFSDPTRRRAMAARRQNGFTAHEDATDSWFNDTPARARFRGRPSLPTRLPENDHDDGSSGTLDNVDGGDLSVSSLRRADKVELFLRYSSVRTELDAVKRQSALEREALLDMLNESRDVVHDLRNERNLLEERLEKETASLRALSAALGGEAITAEAVDHLADLARQKALWQQRATSAAGELERCREDLARYEAGAEASREREEEAAREIEHLEERIDTLTKLLRDAQAALRDSRSSPSSSTRSPAESPRTATFPSSANENSPSAPAVVKRLISPKSVLPSGHTKTMSQGSDAASSPRSRIAHARTPSSGLPTPATTSTSRLPSLAGSTIGTPRNRTVSGTSSTASLERAVDASGTPLQRTKISLAPRTPGSQASPLGGKTASKLPTTRPASKIPSSGLPMPKARTSPSQTRNTFTSPTITPPKQQQQQASVASSPASTDVGFALDDHRLPKRTGGPMSDGWPTPNLRGSNGSMGLQDDDAMFLADIESNRATDVEDE